VPACRSVVSVSNERDGGGAAHLVSLPSPALPAPFSPSPCLSPSSLPLPHHLPSTFHGVDRSRGCAGVGGKAMSKKLTRPRSSRATQKNKNKYRENTQSIAPEGKQLINKKYEISIKYSEYS
jgi:hypothetical protein